MAQARRYLPAENGDNGRPMTLPAGLVTMGGQVLQTAGHLPGLVAGSLPFRNDQLPGQADIAERVTRSLDGFRPAELPVVAAIAERLPARQVAPEDGTIAMGLRERVRRYFGT